MESSRTSLASRTSWRTRFEVLGLGLKASSPRKLPCPLLEDSTIFWTVKLLLENSWNLAKILRRPCSCSSAEKRLKNLFEDLFLRSREKNFADLFYENTCACVLSLGLEHSCPWPREGLSSEGLFLALASDFLCVVGLGLESCVVDSTSANNTTALISETLSILPLSTIKFLVLYRPIEYCTIYYQQKHRSVFCLILCL